MLVRAKEACYPAGIRRRAGDVFEYEGDTLPAHLVEVSPDAPKGDAPKGKQKEVALSEMAMNEAKPKSFIDSVTKSEPKTDSKTEKKK
jgi:hypothetical protein